MYSPGVIVAAVPTTVTRSRCPRTLTRRTQKPVSSLWNVTRSTAPVRCSMGLVSGEVGAKVAMIAHNLLREAAPGTHADAVTEESHVCVPGRTCIVRADSVG